MIPGKINEATRSLGPPPGVTANECDRLWIKDIDDGRFTGMQSAWLPTAEEIDELMRGKPIILTVFSTVHPMISLGVASERLIPETGHGG